MGNVLCVPKERKRRESTKGAKGKKRVTAKTTRTDRKCQRSVDVASRSLGVGNGELPEHRNENQVPTKDCSSERCESTSDSRTDSIQAQPSSTDPISALSPHSTCIVAEVLDVQSPCTNVQPVSEVSAKDVEAIALPNAAQGGPKHSAVEISDKNQAPLIHSIVEDQSVELAHIPASTSIHSVMTTENATNGQYMHASEDIRSNSMALDVDSKKMIPNEGTVSLQSSTSRIDKIKLEMSIADCENGDDIKPNESCDIVDITVTKEPYHGDGDTDKKYKDNLNGKDSVPCDIITSVDNRQTETSNAGIQPARINKSSPDSDVPGNGLPGSNKMNSDSQKRTSLLKKQLIEAVRRNQQLNVLHKRDNCVEMIPRAKSFYRENNLPAIEFKHDKLCKNTLVGEPVRKVSDFEVPKLPPCGPDVPIPLNTKTHVNTIPDVARSEAQNKITWRQTENQSSSGGQAWVSRTPVFQPPAQPLGERALDLFGSVDRMKRSWVIPECRQIETLKLEHCIYPGMYVYPHMRWQYTMDTAHKQDITNRRRDSNTPRTNTCAKRRKMPEQQSKTRPKSKSGGLSHWSRYDNLNNLYKDRH